MGKERTSISVLFPSRRPDRTKTRSSCLGELEAKLEMIMKEVRQRFLNNRFWMNEATTQKIVCTLKKVDLKPNNEADLSGFSSGPKVVVGK